MSRVESGLRRVGDAMLVGALLLPLAWITGTSADGSNSRRPSKPWVAPPKAVDHPNPIAMDQRSIALGKQAYVRECRSCHGAKGTGDGKAGVDLSPLPTDLTDPSLWDQSDGAMFWKITEGRDDMPGHADLMTEQQRWHVVNYMRTLARRPEASLPSFNAPDSCRSALCSLLQHYFDLHAALAKADTPGAQQACASLASASRGLSSQNVASLESEAEHAWSQDTAPLIEIADAMKAAPANIQKLRDDFQQLSTVLITIVTDFGHSESTPLLVYAIGSGDSPMRWLQRYGPPQTPYEQSGLNLPVEPQKRLGARQPQTPPGAVGD
jgi:mono/diheme cytochrome c family protein